MDILFIFVIMSINILVERGMIWYYVVNIVSPKNKKIIMFIG